MRGFAPAPGPCPGPSCGQGDTLDPVAARVVPWTQLRKWLAGRTNNFPLGRGETCGALPLPPTKVIAPGPSCGQGGTLDPSAEVVGGTNGQFPAGAWGNLRGVAPAPHQGHCPWTQLRKWLAGRTGSFPLGRGEYEKASLVKERWQPQADGGIACRGGIGGEDPPAPVRPRRPLPFHLLYTKYSYRGHC